MSPDASKFHHSRRACSFSCFSSMRGLKNHSSLPEAISKSCVTAKPSRITSHDHGHANVSSQTQFHVHIHASHFLPQMKTQVFSVASIITITFFKKIASRLRSSIQHQPRLLCHHLTKPSVKQLKEENLHFHRKKPSINGSVC